MRTKLTFVPVRQDGILADTGVNLSVQCLACKHLGKPVTCDAFPKGIPERIVQGHFDHREPFPDQPNDILFEKRKGAFKELK